MKVGRHLKRWVSNLSKLAKRKTIMVRMGHSTSTVILRKFEFTFLFVSGYIPPSPLSFKD